ncbi:FAH family protein [Streptosporangium nondiastaticum]|uniref:FAH family protein n=1 Tax=Streptosporangium nondiastaticum TaxID=35764 RepID=A0A9X7PF66_9ACTN|nr:FAH family protein [Streptosporangium nondiastaticum]PSJ25526.1 FAH family protein [Streptosporangium nondiastaticum]
MTQFFACTYQGERLVGFDEPADGAPLHLYRAGDDHGAALAAAGFDAAAFAAAAQAAGPAVTVPADRRHEIRHLPPLLPTELGNALVSGFMQTHNVKVSQEAAEDGGERPQPNWFFKGLGTSLRVSGDELTVPAAAVAVCEEAEVVLIYVDDEQGTPRYVGHTFGNDLTDIGRFKRNNGHLSYAKLCDAAVSPWFFAAEPPRSVTGKVSVERDGVTAWEGGFTTGTDALAYRLDDMMEHLFAYPPLHHPGRVHYVFIGADRSSFHAGFRIAHGDRLTIDVTSHGVALTSTISWDGAERRVD